MSEQDILYYQRRVDQALNLAERAADRAARRSHLAMAERYKLLASGAEVPNRTIVARG